MNDKLKRQLLSMTDPIKLQELEDLAVREQRFEDAAIIRDERNGRLLNNLLENISGKPVQEKFIAWICGNGGHVHEQAVAEQYRCYPGLGKAMSFSSLDAAKAWVREACSGKNFYRGICQKRAVRS